jgi:hypothetical protein
MEQNLKIIFYAMGAMILAPQTLSAQSVNIEGLDSLRLSGSVGVVEPELLKKGVLNNALDALSGQTAGVNVTTNGHCPPSKNHRHAWKPKDYTYYIRCSRHCPSQKPGSDLRSCCLSHRKAVMQQHLCYGNTCRCW